MTSRGSLAGMITVGARGTALAFALAVSRAGPALPLALLTRAVLGLAAFAFGLRAGVRLATSCLGTCSLRAF
jgi:hypothetical protein